MSLLKRKRLRRLHWALVGPPALVTPVPIIGAVPEVVEDEMDDCFIFGQEMAQEPRRRGIRIKGPSDAEWAEQYNAWLRGHVTYEPRVARERLLRMLENGNGGSITTLVVETLSDRWPGAQLWGKVSSDQTIERNLNVKTD